MHQVLKEICTALNEVAEKVKSSLTSTNTLKETHNWQFPALTGKELAGLASRLAARIEEADIGDLDDASVQKIELIPRRLRALLSETIPNMNGQFSAVPAYVDTMIVVEKDLDFVLNPMLLKNPNLLPGRVAARLKAVSSKVEKIDSDYAELAARVSEINKAYEAASALPATLQELEEAKSALEEARFKVDKLYEEATKAVGKIEDHELTAARNTGAAAAHAHQAKELVAKCEDAYQITTTKGLAGAFDQRALRLSISMWFWVAGLLAALSGIFPEIGSA